MLSIFSLFGKKYCIICRHKVVKFLPSGIRDNIFTKHHIIGGGYRENCICPSCRCFDRARWQHYVLKNFSGILSKSECSVLHFAPEPYNSALIRQNRNCKYITADIQPGKCDYTVDMTDLSIFGDNSFDYVIANHVLEHIMNEGKAVSELKRVLKDDGIIILSFPVCTDMTTYEDSSITTEEGRLSAFGQKDHVRLYGTDFKERLESYGLDVSVYSPENELTDKEIMKYGFIREDISIFCRLKRTD